MLRTFPVSSAGLAAELLDEAAEPDELFDVLFDPPQAAIDTTIAPANARLVSIFMRLFISVSFSYVKEKYCAALCRVSISVPSPLNLSY